MHFASPAGIARPLLALRFGCYDCQQSARQKLQPSTMTTHSKNQRQPISRRAILKDLALTPLLLKCAPLRGLSLLAGHGDGPGRSPGLPLLDVRLAPHYPSPSPIADILALVEPGSDDYSTEKYAVEIEAMLKQWGDELRVSRGSHAALAKIVDPSIEACLLVALKESKVRAAYGIEVVRREFDSDLRSGSDRFLEGVGKWLADFARIETAEFEIFAIRQSGSSPVTVVAEIRYDLVGERSKDGREERVGTWTTEWARQESGSWIAHKWTAAKETICRADTPVFADITHHALAGVESCQSQLLHGADYWRTVLDGAIGVDVYGNNGVAAGDFDNDGFDDFYVCQPAGLPNRLYRNRGDGTFEDVTEKAGVGVLDDTACALFADFDNKGRQDLLVVCGTGPLLFQESRRRHLCVEARCVQICAPAAGHLHACGDCRLRPRWATRYLFLHVHVLPGPRSISLSDSLLRRAQRSAELPLPQRGQWKFRGDHGSAGLNADNDRYSFACAWGDSNANGHPDLFVANDFGSSQLYRNNGDGTFTVVSSQAHVEGVGAGMSCCWADFDNDGRQDIYVPSMWEAAGQRVSEQKQFHENAPERIRELYQRHARGNALYRNRGDGTFENLGSAGWRLRWDDGPGRLISGTSITMAMPTSMSRTDISQGPNETILPVFSGGRWSPNPLKTQHRRAAYERGWQAINELVRSDNTWHGYARNVMFANNRDGTFTEVSGAVGLDFLEDSRAFALADIDHDGRLEVILKNRNAPQLRILHNAMTEIGDSISFRLRGYKSNRDAIGAAVTVEAGSCARPNICKQDPDFCRSTRRSFSSASANRKGPIRATVRWPSGMSQQFENLPPNHRIEIEEGRSAFEAKPFSKPPAAYARSGATPVAGVPCPHKSRRGSLIR